MRRSGNKRKSERDVRIRPTTIQMKGRPLKVHNISSEGVGLLLEEDGPRFTIGERLEAIPLPLKAGAVNLKGVVTHISVTAGYTLCGIMFQLTGKDIQSLARFRQERTLPATDRP